MAKKQAKKKPNAKAAASNQPLAALYRLDPDTPRGDAVRAVLAEQGFRVRTATAENLNDPVGSLVHMTGIKPSAKPFDGNVPDCEFMLLHNVTSNKLNDLLAAMREAGFPVCRSPFHSPFSQAEARRGCRRLPDTPHARSAPQHARCA